MRRPLFKLAPLLALVLAISACGSGGSSDGLTAGGDRTSIVVAAVYDSAYGSLDPMRNAGTGRDDGTVMAAIYGFLVYLDETDDTVQYDLAKSVASEDGGKTWTLILRDGLTFSDGEPLDAEAVAWNFNRLADPKNGSYHFASMAGVTATAVDEVTVKVVLAEPNASFDRLIAGGAGRIASPTAYEADPEGFARNPVGAGPYVLDKWVAGSSMTLEKSPTYYNADAVTLETVTMNVIADPAQGLNAVSSGQAQIRTNPLPQQLEQAKQSGLGTTELPLSGYNGLALNTRTAPFDDIRARQALAYALDGLAIAQVSEGRSAQPAESLFATDSPFFDPVLPEMNDPARAQELFDELADEGKPVEFRLLSSQAGGSATAEAIQSQLSAYDNVTVTIDARDVQAYTTALTTQIDFEAASYGITFRDPEPRIHDLFSSDGNQNKAGFKTPEIDSLLVEARSAVGDERAEPIKEVQEIVAKQTLILSFSEVPREVHPREGAGPPPGQRRRHRVQRLQRRLNGARGDAHGERPATARSPTSRGRQRAQEVLATC